MDNIEIWILNKMCRRGYWGNRLINFDDLHNNKISRRDLEHHLRNLENLGYIQKKKGDKSSLYRYSLVPCQKHIILHILEEVSLKNGH
ncbi:hypothetical protein JW968_02460 [Candidatus Woesearchaeota archaeon]|nr:hypothetical protein [Candidatus Woesearchaeota archaeon]